MSLVRPTVAALLVTHQSERWIRDVIASIQGQTLAPDALFCVDDHSTDSTVGLLKESGFEIFQSTSSGTDATTRIAQNFLQGVRAARRYDVVVLGDHDDYWLPDRVEHQVRVLQEEPDAWLVASDGRVMGSHESLRETFPIPDDWQDMSRLAQFRYAMRHSIATGGASAVRPRMLLDPSTGAVPIPHGWLHDRWWSLSAVANGAIALDCHPVIEYRVQSDQQVGLDTGRQGTRFPRIGISDVARTRDVARLLRRSRR
jgi:glycosyltransferase involved in cell wall biosynthesis